MWKINVDLPCQIGLDIAISFQLMKHIFLLWFLSWGSYPGVLIFDPIFPHLLTYSLLPHLNPFPLQVASVCLRDEKGMPHISLLYCNMGIKELFCNEAASIIQQHEKSAKPTAELEPGNRLGM